ncbi:MAG: acyl-CoA dehydrogenase [Syntrophus sp. (in: bacteria)]|nr:acyl-CoA dehydrogenase [Syntrophus sp. (in: bacteria)]
METFPWWSEDQKKLAKEIKAFTEEVLPRDVEARWKREFPWDIFKKVAEKGYTGVAVPKEYGGMGLGATGACIVVEAMCRMPGSGRTQVGNMIGGLRQIIEFGSEEQKKRFLPRIAKGELGAVVITEPVAGTDAAAIEMTAKRNGDAYILNGKKRFIVAAGVANRYFVYARTSNNPDDVAKYRHLSAFVVERGAPGFSVEKINEIIGFENIQNGVLDFDDVSVPLADRIGEEGDGWKIMTAGLNFERTLICAMTLGWQTELLKNAVPYAQRRVQFSKPTIDIPANQAKIADLIIRLRLSRIATYYTAYLWDLGWDITLESNSTKVFCAESAQKSSLEAIQVMGGDGVTPFYTPQAFMQVAKVEHIAGGTMEACRQVIFKSGLRIMAEDLTMPRRVIHKDLGVPVPAAGPVEKQSNISEEKVLALLAEDYRINPGLYMSRGDLSEHFTDSAALDNVLIALEEKSLAKVYRTKKGIELAKATYEGLKKAHPKEYYRWFPEWVDGDRKF